MLSDVSVLSRLRAFFFPEYCLDCGEPVGRFDGDGQWDLICSRCAGRVTPARLVEGGRCARCSDYLYGADTSHCWNCSSNPPVFSSSVSLFYYRTHPVRALVRLFKFEGSRAAGNDLSRMIKPELDLFLSRHPHDLLIPVPVAPRALRKRGYNQVEYILKACGASYTPVLTRGDHDFRQSQLGRASRESSIRGQFEVRASHESQIAGKSILVADDIMTTGSTINEIAGILLERGAREVSGITFFRD